MEEGPTARSRTTPEPPVESAVAFCTDRDQARVELRFVMDERDRLDRQARTAAAERDRFADTLRAVEAERDLAREGLAAATADRIGLSAEAERLRADLDAARRAIAKAEEEIAWLRALTEQLVLPGRARDGDG